MYVHCRNFEAPLWLSLSTPPPLLQLSFVVCCLLIRLKLAVLTLMSLISHEVFYDQRLAPSSEYPARSVQSVVARPSSNFRAFECAPLAFLADDHLVVCCDFTISVFCLRLSPPTQDCQEGPAERVGPQHLLWRHGKGLHGLPFHGGLNVVWKVV